jgi:hypothetical protein
MDLRKLSALSLFAVLLVGGCRFKGAESFSTATTPQAPGNPAWGGDPYASGGIAEATGGLNTDTQYSEGSGADNGEKIDPTYNRPGYGSGQRPGEAGSYASPGHGTSNAPAFQASPNGTNR